MKNYKMGCSWGIQLDLGFQGFVKDYAYDKVFIPHKRKRTKKGQPKQELTESQRNQNKQMASTRIRVEHSIGGMKRFRILANKCRLKKRKQFNQIVGVCAALWNLKIDLKT